MLPLTQSPCWHWWWIQNSDRALLDPLLVWVQSETIHVSDNGVSIQTEHAGQRKSLTVCTEHAVICAILLAMLQPAGVARTEATFFPVETIWAAAGLIF